MTTPSADRSPARRELSVPGGAGASERTPPAPSRPRVLQSARAPAQLAFVFRRG